MTRPAFVVIAAASVALIAAPVVAQVRTQLVVSGLTNPVAWVMDPVDHSTFYVV